MEHGTHCSTRFNPAPKLEEVTKEWSQIEPTERAVQWLDYEDNQISRALCVAEPGQANRRQRHQSAISAQAFDGPTQGLAMEEG